MKKFKYQANTERLKLNDAEAQFFAKDNQKTIFEQMLVGAVTAAHEKGVGGKLQRTLGRILDKLDRAVDEYLFLEESEFDLLKEYFDGDNCKFHPANTRLIIQYRDNLQNAEGVEQG